MVRRPRRLAALAIGLTGVAAIATPALASPTAPALGGVVAAAESVAVQPRLAERLAATAPDAPMQVFLHADHIASAIAGADVAGLTVIETYDRVGVAVAVGLPNAVSRAIADPAITYVEDAEVALRFQLDTSHEATRGIEVVEGFELDTSEPIAEDDADAQANARRAERRAAAAQHEADEADARAQRKEQDADEAQAAADEAQRSADDADPKDRAAAQTKADKAQRKADRKQAWADQARADADDAQRDADAAQASAEAARVVRATQTVSFDGTGIGIAIVDSGVDAEHPFFRLPDGTSKVVRNLEYLCSDVVTIVDDGAGQPCLVDAPLPMSDTTSVGGHGTHVAGIAAGVVTPISDGRTLMGAAPGAELTSLSVGAGLNITGATSGLYWVLENHENPCGEARACAPIKVVNNSWGSDPADYNPNAAAAKLSDALIAEGVVVAFAASNDGGDGSSNMVNPYAQNPTPGLLNVANYDDGGTGTRDGSLDGSSSRGEAGRVQTYPDFSAPGANILSSCRIYLPVCSTGLEFVEDGDYNSISGTSMATPHIAGIVAQLFQADPTLTPAEVEDILEDTAYKFSFGGAYEADVLANGVVRNADDTTSFDKGHGLVDVVAAVSRVLGGSGPEAVATCRADAAVITDAEGDATAYLGQPTPRPNVSSLDILDGTVTERHAGDTLLGLDWTISVQDLQETPPDGAVGEYFDWNFTYNGQSYYLGLGWDRTDGTRFVIGFIETTRMTLRSDLEGSFDVDTDEITVFLPVEAFVVVDENGDPANGAAPEITDGAVFGGHEIVARYDQFFLVPDADSAAGACPYTVGLGAVPPPVVDEPVDPIDPVEPDPHTPEDGTYELDGRNGITAYHVDGGAGTATSEVGLGVTADDVDEYIVDIAPGSFATVDVTLLASDELAQDVDFEVVDATGTVVASSGNPGGAEAASFAITRPGTYTVRVIRYLTVEATYSLDVALAELTRTTPEMTLDGVRPHRPGAIGRSAVRSADWPRARA